METQQATEELLDCGHPPSPHGAHTTGYGIDQEGRKHCYECCTKKDIEELKTADRFTAYLHIPDVEPHRHSNVGATLTNWPGGVLFSRLYVTKTKAGFGGERWYGQATDPHGNRWTFNSPGPGMYARLRKLKAKR